MPIPAIMLSKNMSNKELQHELNRMRDWCFSPEAFEMKFKSKVLRSIINYSSENLIFNENILSSWLYPDSKKNDFPYETINKIFDHVDLSELHFLHYVIEQVTLLNATHPALVESILPSTKKNRDTMLVPIIYEMRMMGVAIAAFSILFRFNLGLITGGLILGLSGKIAEHRVTQALKYKLALKAMNNITPRVEDGYDNKITNFVNISTQGYQMVATLFNAVASKYFLAETSTKEHIKKRTL